jgi:hypothetical protein
MFTVERRVGRLCEARVQRLADPSRVAAYSEAFRRPLVGITGPVLCADHRPVAIYPQPVADGLVELFKSLNTRWHRVAILVARTNATLAMQLQRIVRESENPSRRVFFDADEARQFLDDALDKAERARLQTFLGEG